MKREFDPGVPEQMDVVTSPGPELKEDLRNLEKLNLWFGSHALVLGFCRRWFLPGQRYRVIDLATGYGDIPRVMVRWARAHEVSLQIEARDFSEATLALAREASVDYPEIHFAPADVLLWQPELSADAVLFSLALHHFSEKDATDILRRLAASGIPRVLVADLCRCRRLQFGVWLLTALLMRNPMTRHDARLSVRRAFSAPEMRALAAAAGWTRAMHRLAPSFRQVLWQE
jgi:hypothetical protein